MTRKVESMDHRLIKGIATLAAVALYLGASYIGDPTIEDRMRELATLLFGWQSMRRPGDLPPQNSITGYAP